MPSKAKQQCCLGHPAQGKKTISENLKILIESKNPGISIQDKDLVCTSCDMFYRGLKEVRKNPPPSQGVVVQQGTSTSGGASRKFKKAVKSSKSKVSSAPKVCHQYQYKPAAGQENPGHQDGFGPVLQNVLASASFVGPSSNGPIGFKNVGLNSKAFPFNVPSSVEFRDQFQLNRAFSFGQENPGSSQALLGGTGMVQVSNDFAGFGSISNFSFGAQNPGQALHSKFGHLSDLFKSNSTTSKMGEPSRKSMLVPVNIQDPGFCMLPHLGIESRKMRIGRHQHIVKIAKLIIHKMWNFLAKNFPNEGYKTIMDHSFIYCQILKIERQLYECSMSEVQHFLQMDILFNFLEQDYDFLRVFDGTELIFLFSDNQEFRNTLIERFEGKSNQYFKRKVEKLIEVICSGKPKITEGVCLLCLNYHQDLLSHERRAKTVCWRSIRQDEEEPKYPFFNGGTYLCCYCPLVGIEGVKSFYDHISNCPKNTLEFPRLKGQRTHVAFFNLTQVPEGNQTNQKAEIFWKGGQQDIQNLTCMFQKIDGDTDTGYEFKESSIFQDSNSENIQIQAQTFLDGATNAYALYVFINGHGMNEGVKMTDGFYISFINFMSLFNKTEFENVPKIFYFLTCRTVDKKANLQMFDPKDTDIDLKNCFAHYSAKKGYESTTSMHTGSNYLMHMSTLLRTKTKELKITEFSETMAKNLGIEDSLDISERHKFSKSFEMLKKFADKP